jgi:hypothetical protein
MTETEVLPSRASFGVTRSSVRGPRGSPNTLSARMASDPIDNGGATARLIWIKGSSCPSDYL